MIDIISEWNKDPEFQKLDLERKRSILGNFFDRNMADDEFFALPEDKQTRIKDNFFADHGLEPKPEVSVARLAGAPFEGLKDVAKSFTAGLGGVMKHGLPEYARAGAEAVIPALRAIPRGLPTEQLAEPLLELSRSEELENRPEYAGGKSSGWVEDFLRGAPQMGGQIVATLAGGPLAGMGFMALQITGDTYENAVKQGKDPENALAWGLANAIIQTPMEQFGISKIANIWKPQKLLWQKLKDIGQAMGVEWLTEFFQSYPDSLANIFAANPDKTAIQNLISFVDQAWETTKQGAYEGTLTAPWALLGLGGVRKPGAPPPPPAQEQGQPSPVLTQEQNQPPPVLDVEQVRAAYQTKQLDANDIQVLMDNYPAQAVDLDSIRNDHILDRVSAGENIETVIQQETPKEFITRSMGEVEDVRGPWRGTPSEGEVEQVSGPTREEAKPSPSVTVEGKPTPDMGPTPMEQLRGYLYGKPVRVVERKEVIPSGEEAKEGQREAEAQITEQPAPEPGEKEGQVEPTEAKEPWNETYDWLDGKKAWEVNVADFTSNMPIKLRYAIATPSHKLAVKQALKAGENVPASVLSDYPDLTEEKLGEKIPPKSPKQEPTDLLPVIKSLQPIGQERALVPISELRDKLVGDLTSKGYIPIYRGTGKRGFQELKSTEGGVQGTGIYFYTEPMPARSHATTGGGVITAYIKPEDAIIKGNVAIVKDPSKVIIRGKIPVEETTVSGKEWLDRTNKELSQGKMTNEEFDKQLLQLSQEGKVALHQHDFPASLTPENRAKLLAVKDKNFPNGMAYYVGVVPIAEQKEVTPPAEQIEEPILPSKPTDALNIVKGEGGRFKAAYLDKDTGKVYVTGQIHDASKLPAKIENKVYEKKGAVISGFSDENGKFYTGDEALAESEQPAPAEAKAKEPVSIIEKLESQYKQVASEMSDAKADFQSFSMEYHRLSPSRQKRMDKQYSEKRRKVSELENKWNRLYGTIQDVRSGKPVPPEVLKDYPDLRPARTDKIGDQHKAIQPKEQATEIDDTVSSFTSEMSPMQVAKVKTALDKTLSFDGKLLTRKDGIKRAVSSGAVIVQGKEGRRLQKPDGAFLAEKDISKTGMDYAEHLISLKAEPPAKKEAVGEKTEAKEQAISKEEAKLTPGRAWVKDAWRPFTEYREFKKGKSKGWFEIVIQGKKRLVKRENIKTFPGTQEEAKVEAPPIEEKVEVKETAKGRVVRGELKVEFENAAGYPTTVRVYQAKYADLPQKMQETVDREMNYAQGTSHNKEDFNFWYGIKHKGKKATIFERTEEGKEKSEHLTQNTPEEEFKRWLREDIENPKYNEAAKALKERLVVEKENEEKAASEKAEKEQAEVTRIKEEWNAYREAIDKVKLPTGKKVTIQAKDKEGKPFDLEGTQYGNFLISKRTTPGTRRYGGQVTTYGITHVPTGGIIDEAGSLDDAKVLLKAIIHSKARTDFANPKDLSEEGVALWKDVVNSVAKMQAPEYFKKEQPPSVEGEIEERKGENYGISKPEFEDMIERQFNTLREYYSDEGIKTWRQYLEKLGAETIALEVESNYELYNRYLKRLPEGVTAEDVIEAYKRGELAQYKVAKERTKPLETGKAEAEQLGTIGEPKRVEPLSNADSKAVWDKANSRITKNNAKEVNDARATIFFQAALTEGLPERIGVKQKDIVRKLRSWSNFPWKSVLEQQRLNNGKSIPTRWHGITNSAWLSKQQVTPEQIDQMVKKVDATDKSWGTPNGQSLRNYISRVLLGVDTRILFNDLTFRIESTLKPLGQYFHNQLLIKIRENSPHTVAHEIGHYLDHKWADEAYRQEFDHSSPNAASTLLDHYVGNIGPLRKQWLKRYSEFVMDISERSEIGSEYYQDRGEVFARFFAKFIDWTNEKAGQKTWGEQRYSQDRFNEGDYRRFVGLLQEKAYVDIKEPVTTKETKPEEEVSTISPMGAVSTGPFPSHPSAQAIEKHLAPILAKLPGLPTVQVLESWEALPKGIKDFYEKKMQEGTYAALFVRFNNGKQAIYLIADRQASLNTALNSLWHESGHYALRKALVSESPEYRGFLDDLYNSRYTGVISEVGKGYGFNMDTVEGKRKAADEWWAMVTATEQFGQNNPWYQKTWDKFVAIVRKFLNSIGIKRPMSKAEIRDMMRRSYRELERPIMAGEGAEVAGVSADTMRQLAPTFYSQMQNILDKKLPNAGTAAQFRQMIKSWADKGEFKADEWKWSGVDDWLAGKEGKVTKQEVLDFLKANEVQIKEVTKGGERLTPEQSDRLEVLSQKDEEGGLSPEEAKEYRKLSQMVSDYKKGGGYSTKFNQWQLPGGENYRELLLTLPNVKESDVRKFYEDRYLNDKIWKGEIPEAFKWEKLSPHQINTQYREYRKEKRVGEDYTSAHWSEPNVLAHVRFNDRTGPNGEKILFLEEVQSDWHQEGRKKGYNTGQMNEADKAFAEYEKQLEEKYGGRPARGNLTWNEGQKWDELFYASSASDSSKKGVPPAPFSKTWHELAMKRILRHAAENGYDRVAWTTGEQQAERYDLSKQVDEIVVFKTDYPDGTRNYRVLAIKGGENVIDRGGLKENELADLIGKDLAQKAVDTINTGKRASFKGDNLKVGGEGMKGFYDKIIPDYLNKYAKKWGARVEDIKIITPSPNAHILEYRAVERKGTEMYYGGHTGWMIEARTSEGWKPFYGAAEPISEDEAKRKASEMNMKAEKDKIGTPVHSLPVTESMRESVLLQGQAMFQKLLPGDVNTPIIKDVQLIHPSTDRFDLKQIDNRRFMYNPGTDELVLGYEGGIGKQLKSTHAQEWKNSGAIGKYDDAVRGWIGTSKALPDGIIHFAPPIADRAGNVYGLENGRKTLAIFASNGMTDNTKIRGYPGKWEQPYSAVAESVSDISGQKLTPLQEVLAKLNAAHQDGSAKESVGSKGKRIIASKQLESNPFNEEAAKIAYGETNNPESVMDQYKKPDGTYDVDRFYQDTGIIAHGGSPRDLNKYTKWIQTVQDLAHNYPALRRALEVWRNWKGGANQMSINDRDTTESYFTLPHKVQLQVNKALVDGDRENRHVSNDRLEKEYGLDEKGRKAYWDARKALDQKKDLIVNYYVSTVIGFKGMKKLMDKNAIAEEAELLDKITGAINKRNDKIARKLGDATNTEEANTKLRESLSDLSMDNSDIETILKEHSIADWALNMRAYIPHKWKENWRVFAKDKDGTRYVFDVPSIKAKTALSHAARNRAAKAAGLEVVKKRLGVNVDPKSIRVFEAKKLPLELFEGTNEGVMRSIIEAAADKADQELFAGMDDAKKIELATIRDAIKEHIHEMRLAKGWGAHLIGRKNVQGYREDDLHEAIAEYLVQFNGWYNKGIAARKFAEVMEEINPKDTPQLWKYTKEYISDMLSESSEAANFKKIVSLYFLAADVSAAALNMTQNFTHATGMLRSIKGKHPAEQDITKAMKDVSLSWVEAKTKGEKLFSEGGKYITKEEALALRTAFEKGMLDPQYFGEVTGLQSNKIYHSFLQDVHRYLYIAFTASEGLNRMSTFLASYRRARDAGLADPVTKAAEITNASHFIYGKGTRPEIIRKFDRVGPGIGSMLYTFMTYPMQNIAFIKNRIEDIKFAKGQDRKTAIKILASNLAYIGAFGGLNALPGMFLLKMLYSWLTDPEDDWEKWIREHTPQSVGRGVTRGLPSIVGNDLSWKVEGTDILGAPIGFQTAKTISRRVQNMWKEIKRGEEAHALFMALPDVVRNPYLAISETLAGTGIEGRPPIKYEGAEKAWKAMGFTPIRESEMRATMDIARRKREDRLDKVESFAERYARAKTKNDQAALNNLMKDVNEYNTKERAKGDLGLPIKWKKDIVENAKRRMETRKKPYSERLPKYMRKYQEEIEQAFE